MHLRAGYMVAGLGELAKNHPELWWGRCRSTSMLRLAHNHRPRAEETTRACAGQHWCSPSNDPQMAMPSRDGMFRWTRGVSNELIFSTRSTNQLLAGRVHGALNNAFSVNAVQGTS